MYFQVDTPLIYKLIGHHLLRTLSMMNSTFKSKPMDNFTKLNFAIEIGNSTLEFNQMEPFLKLNFQSKIGLSSFILLILGSGMAIQIQLISFLKSKSNRLVNKLIYLNLISQNILTPPMLCFKLFSLWIENLSEIISGNGCYAMFYIISFGVILDRAHSFFINLFRYICIVQDEFLKKFNIQAKVST